MRTRAHTHTHTHTHTQRHTHKHTQTNIHTVLSYLDKSRRYEHFENIMFILNKLYSKQY